MAVSFLDIAPKPQTETIIVETTSGPAEVALCGVPFTTLAEISKRYSAFAKLIEGGAASMIDASDAMPALVAAGLGHPADEAYERKVRTFPTADIMRMAVVVIRLTFPAPTADPLSLPAPLPDGADAAPMRQTSLRP